MFSWKQIHLIVLAMFMSVSGMASSHFRSGQLPAGAVSDNQAREALQIWQRLRDTAKKTFELEVQTELSALKSEHASLQMNPATGREDERSESEISMKLYANAIKQQQLKRAVQTRLSAWDAANWVELKWDENKKRLILVRAELPAASVTNSSQKTMVAGRE